MITTGYWFTKLPAGLQKVGVSRGTPKAMIGKVPTMPELFPGAWFHSVDAVEYRKRYLAILAKLDPYAIVEKLDRLCGPSIPVLCCWEKNDGTSWCHRGYIADWITSNTGVVVEELQSPNLHCLEHPMLPEQFRQPRLVIKPAGRPRPNRKAA